MSQRDLRAVDNPISAVFDLAEDVNREVPRIRKLVLYATLFNGFWLVISFIILIALAFTNFILALGMLLLFIVGILAMAMLRNLSDFISYYAQRHAAILRVRNEDPIVYVPKGETSVLRLMELLRSRNPNMAGAIGGHQYQSPAILRGGSSVLYEFDAYLAQRPGTLWRLFGVGYPGYQLFVKCFHDPPRSEDLAALKNAIEDVSRSTRLPPSRAIALWTRKTDQQLSDDSYQFLSIAVILFGHRTKRYASTLELVIENEDGTYEFIPFVAEGGAYFSAPRAQ